MSNLLNLINSAIEDETFESPETEFVINNDQKAEWALQKIREEKAESERLISLCQNQIKFYQERIDCEKQSLENRTSYLKSKLMEYFQTVKRKVTKTQETYTLPSGKLKLKYPALEYKRDESALLKWLKERQMEEYIQVKEIPQWGELKKTVQVAGDKVCVDGEIVDGVQVVERPPVFDVEV